MISNAVSKPDESISAQPSKKPSVYVHLDHGRGLVNWTNAYRKGLVFEKQPYGYHWAEPWVRLAYSSDAEEGGVFRLVRRGFKFLLGFDLIHAFRNRGVADTADVIWTHTESEWLADALLMKLRLMKRVPLVGQSVWLWDKWPNWSGVRQRLHQWLFEEVAVATTHSASNAKVGTAHFGRDVLVVPFGIEPIFQAPPKGPRGAGRLRVVAPGNDRDRDWKILQQVARDNPDIEIVVLSKRRHARKLVVKDVPNFVVRPATGVEDLIDQYASADVVAIPLRPNLHASGVSVAMEGLNAGRPVVITRVGGVEDYFGEAVDYVVPSDARRMADALRNAAEKVCDIELLERRRRHLFESGLLIKDFGRRHVLLTRIALKTGTENEMRALSQFAPVVIDPMIAVHGDLGMGAD